MRVFVYFIVFFSFFDLFTQLPIMTPFANSLGATPFLTGLAVGMYSFSNTIGNVASGFMTDKRGPFVILVTGLLSTGVMLLFYLFAIDAWSLLLIRFFHGLAGGLIVPAAFTYLANTTAKEKKGKGAALSGAFVGLAAVIGPAFSGIMASKTSEVAVFSITAVFMFLLGVLSLFILKAKPIVVGKVNKREEQPISVRIFFQNSLTIKAFMGALFLMFSQGVVAYMLPLKVMDLGSDTQTSGLLMSTFGIVAILVFILPTNNLFDRIRPIKTAAFGMGAMGASLLCISIASSITQLYAVMALYGIGFAFLFPSLNSLLIEATEKAYRGKAYGYFYAFFSIGVVLGSGVTGLLNLSADGGFLLTGIILFIGVLFLLFMQRKSPVSPQNL